MSKLLNYTALFILYFVQGIPFGYQSRYLPLIMRRENVSLTSLGLLKLLLLPWACKFFLAALLVDTYRTKRFWLVTSLLVLALGSYMGMFMTSFTHISAIVFLLNWASAVQDICVDWFAINMLAKEDLGLGNTIQVGAYKLGTLFSGGLLVYLMDYLSMQSAFCLLGSIYLACLLVLALPVFKIESVSAAPPSSSGSRQTRRRASENLYLSVSERIKLLGERDTLWMCVFLLIYKVGEQSSINMIPLYLFDRKVKSTTIGFYTGILGQIVSIVGTLVAGFVLRKQHRFSSEFWLKHTLNSRVIPSILVAYFIYVNDYYYWPSASSSLSNSESTLDSGDNDLYGIVALFLVQLFLSGFLTTVTFTVMMEHSLRVPLNVQATHYSLLTTTEVFGKLIVQPFASAFTDYYGYAHSFALFSLFYMFCPVIMLFIKLY